MDHRNTLAARSEPISEFSAGDVFGFRFCVVPKMEQQIYNQKVHYYITIALLLKKILE